ncbi:flagellar basal-body MS-ring/collar protein FliF [Mangrovibrevibacter kandeliae]|uniref:flagellar basal-body MS-ring/collar protein FliF n=1 Tax=Mangrovibrevibacter kandeliae TaxID=2968473 RepID=UPI002117A098|nr:MULTISPECIES: flagellar basal-body MS-ring/collar protein FliF [unclassified Aurantimonas]MCQ8780926.1 flagellar M-ring protein FliF [Aurantimonas sp. CSK15Z-1]MCW4113707.1 flagellar basal-body MS-ring/collar protein FliF [Aurantimonas sp. MSK8Z-1]
MANLSALGPRKLAALGIIGALVVAIIGLGAYYLSRPDMETLYSGLERADVTQIGAALTEAGIPFDVSSDGASVLTPFSQTANARALLAENGLPRSEKAGYELFDELGSIGLTSFMQEVTRVRALEGEIARTIQSMQGIRAARVHIVLADEGSFRRERQKPSASVVIRTDNGTDGASEAQAIRHLVAAAIPDMTPDEVTILSSDGTLLASGDDSVAAAPTKVFGIEKTVSSGIEDSIRRTLAPYLGVGNFQTSVIAKLNTDRKQIDEKIFDPDGRVERSTRTVKENQKSANSTTQDATTVNQNIPQEANNNGSGKNENQESERREELTNYEINEKTVQTVSNGYQVERLSVAVVVNRERVAQTIGDNATEAQIDEAMQKIQALVASAAGYQPDRGDQLQVTAVDFATSATDLEPVPSAGFGEMFMRQSGTLINALTALVVAVLLIWFGLKPAIRAITAAPAESAMAGFGSDDPIELANAGFGEGDGEAGEGDPELSNDLAANLLAGLNFDGPNVVGDAFGEPQTDDLLDELNRSKSNSPQARLEKLIDFDEQQAAQILKQWIHQKEAA